MGERFPRIASYACLLMRDYVIRRTRPVLSKKQAGPERRDEYGDSTRTPILTSGRDSQLIDIHLHARTKSNFAEVGFGARIARPKNTRYPRNSSPSIGIPVIPTSDFGFNHPHNLEGRLYRYLKLTPSLPRLSAALNHSFGTLTCARWRSPNTRLLPEAMRGMKPMFFC